MTFLLKRNSFSQLRSHSQNGHDLLSQSRRGLHVAPGPDEQALLASRVKTLKRVGGVLTVVVVAGICYAIDVNRSFVVHQQQTVAKAFERNRDKTLVCSVSSVHVGRDGITMRFIPRVTDAMNQTGLGPIPSVVVPPVTDAMNQAGLGKKTHP